MQQELPGSLPFTQLTVVFVCVCVCVIAQNTMIPVLWILCLKNRGATSISGGLTTGLTTLDAGLTRNGPPAAPHVMMMLTDGVQTVSGDPVTAAD